MASLGLFHYLFPIFIGLGLMGPLGIPPLKDTPTISKIAPEQCLFYMSSAGRADAKADSPNQVEQLMAEPEVQKLATELETLIKAFLDKQAGKPGAPPLSSDEMTLLAKMVLNRPLAVYVGDVKMGTEGPVVRGGLIVHLGDKAKEFKTLLEKVSELLPPDAITKTQDGKTTWSSFKPEPNTTITWGTKGDYFVAALGEGEAQAMIKRGFGKTPAWLANLRKNSGVERISSVAYLNVKSVLQLVVPLGPPNASQTFDAVGLSNLSNATMVVGLDKTGLIAKTSLNFDGAPYGIFEAIGKPLTADDLASVPADAASVSAMKIDLKALYQTVLKIVEQADPNAKAEMLRNIGMLEAQFGLKLDEDILDPLGDTFFTYNAMKAGEPPFGFLVVSLKDAQKAKTTNGKIVQILKNNAQMNPASPKVVEIEYEGKMVYGLQAPNTPFLQAAWCITDKELVVASSAERLDEYLKRPADSKSLAKTPELAKSFEKGSAPSGIVYNDMKKFFDFAYPQLTQYMPMASFMLKSQGVDLNPSMLPKADAISGHLLPLTVSLRKTSSSIEIVERSSLPMPIFASPVNPISLALLLPALQASREAARRANPNNNAKQVIDAPNVAAPTGLEQTKANDTVKQVIEAPKVAKPASHGPTSSNNNVKEIVMILFNYRDLHKTFPPAYKAGKDGKPLLSWRVLILPILREDELYKQFKLDEPWDSENNKKLIPKMPDVYKSSNANDAPGMTHYLVVRGEKTIFPGAKGIKVSEVTDGLSRTISTVEADKAVPWTKPEDFEYDESNPLKGLGGLQPNGFLAGFADGSVRFISTKIDATALKALFTRDGNEAVDPSKLP